MGLAESHFPNPAEWGYARGGGRLDQLSVKVLTALFRDVLVKQPSCMGNWEGRLGPVPWCLVGARYRHIGLVPYTYGVK